MQCQCIPACLISSYEIDLGSDAYSTGIFCPRCSSTLKWLDSANAENINAFNGEAHRLQQPCCFQPGVMLFYEYDRQNGDYRLFNVDCSHFGRYTCLNPQERCKLIMRDYEHTWRYFFDTAYLADNGSFLIPATDDSAIWIKLEVKGPDIETTLKNIFQKYQEYVISIEV